jgi:hypothetical protein
MYYTILQTRVLSCTLTRSVFSRAHHSATARFITLSSKGTPVTREIEVWLGDPGNSYIMFDPEISQGFKTGTILHGGCSLAQDQHLYPLKFYHDTRHFSHGEKFNVCDIALKTDYMLFRIVPIPPPRDTSRPSAAIKGKQQFSNSSCLWSDSCDYT